MINSLIRRGFQGSILLLLSLVLTVGFASLSTRTSASPSGRIGSTPHDNRIIPKPIDFANTASSQRTNQPTFLRYLIRLLGNDWLGADWLYLGLRDYRYPALNKNGQQPYTANLVTGEKTSQGNYARFWTDPGPALLKVGDTLWVWGYAAGSYTFYADSILVNPPARTAPPDDVSAFGIVLTLTGQTITIQTVTGIRSTVIGDQYTNYSFPAGEGLPRPQKGLWLHISWLTGSTGWMGRYDGFHGTYRGILRLDFSQP